MLKIRYRLKFKNEHCIQTEKLTNLESLKYTQNRRLDQKNF